jgi:hypothetical protein
MAVGHYTVSNKSKKGRKKSNVFFLPFVLNILEDEAVRAPLSPSLLLHFYFFTDSIRSSWKARTRHYFWCG